MIRNQFRAPFAKGAVLKYVGAAGRFGKNECGLVVNALDGFAGLRGRSNVMVGSTRVSVTQHNAYEWEEIASTADVPGADDSSTQPVAGKSANAGHGGMSRRTSVPVEEAGTRSTEI